MALQKTQIGFPFLKGINQKPSEKSQAAGELTDAKNFCMDKTGRLDRRLGFERYPRATVQVGDTQAGSITSAKAMAHLGDEILLFEGEEVFSKASDDKWVKRADILNIRNEARFINRSSTSTSGTMSYAISGNFEYCAWAEQPYDTGGDGTSLLTGNMPRYKYLVRDRHTGATIVPTQEIPTAPIMNTSITFTGTVTDGNSGNITGTGFLDEVSMGNYITLQSDAGTEPEKYLVTAVASTSLTLDTHLDYHHTSNITMTIWKDTGRDCLFWAPRLRLLAIPGTSHVYLLTQEQNKVNYLYANTASGTHSDLELGGGEVLHTIDASTNYPLWDADWLLTNDTTHTYQDDAAIVLFATAEISSSLRIYSVDSGGGLTYRRSDSPEDIDDLYPIPQEYKRAIATASSPTQENQIYQPFVKVLHSTDSDGTPTVTANSKILVGYTGGEYDPSKDTYTADIHTHIFCYSHTLGEEWNSRLYTPAQVGISDSPCLARAGIAYDGTSASIMAEVHGFDISAARQPQTTYIVFAKFTVSDGTRTEQRTLWSNVSIQSDGFIPPGSSRPYWWFSAAQPASTTPVTGTYHSQNDLSLNSITFLSDQNGRIQAHGTKGNAGLNTMLEYRSMEQGAEDGPSRNMQGLVARVTEGRWETSGSTEFWCGSSMTDIGTVFQRFINAQPALIKWDTDPYRPFRSESAHGLLYTCGGLLWSYDGNRFIESEFLLSPVIVSVGAPVESTATSRLPEGTYNYYVTYEFQDDEGVKHISPPAGPAEVVSDGTQRGQLEIALTQVTNHRYSDGPRNPATYAVNIYRSNTDGTVHYLHKTMKANEWGQQFFPTEQVILYDDTDPTQHNVFSESLVWDAVPAQLAGNPVPSPVDIARHKDSMMVASTENILYSSLGLVSGFAATFPGVVAENAGAYALYGDSFQSPITHIASNGPSFLFFTADSIYGLDGEGPTSTGEGTWSRPVKISEGQGVRPDGFVAETPMGVLYSSHNGIYIVGRDVQVMNIGAAVDDYALNPAANDPLILDSRNEVIIPIWGGDPDDLTGGVNRTALVFNYFHKQWYRLELPQSVHPGRNVEWLSWVDNNDNVVLHLVGSEGYLYKQKTASSTNPYGDATNTGYTIPVECSAETSWIQFPDYGGKMRIYRILMMGTFDAASSGDTTTLELKSWTNFNGASANETFTSTVTAGGIGSDDKQGSSEIVMKPGQQKAESLRVSFTMSSGSAGKGWSPEGLLFEVGHRKSPTRFKVNSNKQAS